MDSENIATGSINKESNGTSSSNIDVGQVTLEDPIGVTAAPLEHRQAKSDAVAVDDVQNKSPSTRNRIRERLDRELALSKTNRVQLQSYWRQVLVKEKFQELHDEIPKLIKFHDENVARKEELIDSLHKGIHCLHELHRDAMNSNMNSVESFIAIHNGIVGKLECDFRDRVSSFQTQYCKDLEAINSQYGKEKEEIRRCVELQAEIDERRITAIRQVHSRELEEIRNRNRDIIDGIRSIMDSKIDELGEQFERTRGEFAQNTDGTRIEYAQLKSKDDVIRKEIAAKMRHASKLKEEIKILKLIANQEEKQICERHRELLDRKTRATAKWNSMQERMTMYRDEQQKRLLDLIRNANERKEVLKRQCELAERVKTIVLACQKLESSREKYASLLREATCREEGELAAEEDEKSEQRALIVWCMGRLGDPKQHFWIKYNTAKLDVLILERDVRRLKMKEEDLRMKLKRYRDGITVNDDVMNDRNALFVINGKMNVMLPDKTSLKSRRLTVVDGNHFVANNIKN